MEMHCSLPSVRPAFDDCKMEVLKSPVAYHSYTHIPPLASCRLCRIQCKILSIYKALHGLAPAYVMDLRHPSSSACSLRTKNLKLITVPCSRIWTHGDRAFEVVAPKIMEFPTYAPKNLQSHWQCFQAY